MARRERSDPPGSFKPQAHADSRQPPPAASQLPASRFCLCLLQRAPPAPARLRTRSLSDELALASTRVPPSTHPPASQKNMPARTPARDPARPPPPSRPRRRWRRLARVPCTHLAPAARRPPISPISSSISASSRYTHSRQARSIDAGIAPGLGTRALASRHDRCPPPRRRCASEPGRVSWLVTVAG